MGATGAARTVLVVGCIHGNECAALPVAGRLAAGPPVPGVRLLVVPNANPDGRRAGTRGNRRGVDLNRNFATGWRPIPRSSRYHSGPRPFSEPESRVLRDLIARERPDLSIWFHQPEVNVRDDSSSAEARRYARLVGLPFRPLAAPPGAATSWTKARVAGARAFVVELPPGSMRVATVARHLAAVRAVAAGR